MIDENKSQGGIQVRTREFAVRIIKYVLYLKELKVEYSLRDQLLRSGTSIGANIIEASASSSRKEFTRLYEIALRSSNETDYWIDLINRVYNQNEMSQNLLQELNSIRRIVGSIIIKLKAESLTDTASNKKA